MPLSSIDPALKIRLCGALHVELNGVRLDEILLHHYRGALLAFLALQPGAVHKTDDVVARLWPDGETPSLSNLSLVVNSTRRALRSLSDGLVSHYGTLRLEPRGLVVDVLEFETAWSERQTDPDRLASTLDLCSQPLLESWVGWYDRPWVQDARARCSRRTREARRWLVEMCATQGDFDEAIHHLEMLREQKDLAAELHVSVMERLVNAQHFVTATQLYEGYREHLDVHPERLVPPREMLDLYGRIPHRSQHVMVWMPHAPTSSEPITGAMSLENPYYIERPADSAVRDAVRRGDSIVRIEGSRQTGKTSLLARGLEYARIDGAAVISLDFQMMDADDLVSSYRLLRAIAHSICEQLDLAVTPGQVWDSLLSPKANFHSYIRREVVRKSERAVVFAIDEVDRIFDRSYNSDLFGLFRSWHNTRALDTLLAWDRFTLVLAYATDAHLLIRDINESPFNVGTQIALQDFTGKEIAELNERHGNPLRDRSEFDRLLALVGGHPYMVQRCLGEIKAGDRNMDQLEEEADKEVSIFRDHLHRISRLVSQDAGLVEAIRALLSGVEIRDPDVFSRLRSAGILIGTSTGEARFRCGLYERYLRRRFA